MAEAPIKWKIKTLKEIIAAPLGASWIPTPGTQDMDWFIDMKKDGYVEGTWGRLVDMEELKSSIRKATLPGLHSGKEVFSDLHVTTKGKQLVEDYEAKTTFRGIWKRYHLLIFGWIFGIASALVIKYLSDVFFH
jgi:hypothetical protein